MNKRRRGIFEAGLMPLAFAGGTSEAGHCMSLCSRPFMETWLLRWLSECVLQNMTTL